mmetsp:Transcript_16265/g.29753  ORF Transcript_16265/g.29753 Transcript_16265/m.29753 type:complete len:493 (+) Transcript_16265:3-1481(+)
MRAAARAAWAVAAAAAWLLRGGGGVAAALNLSALEESRVYPRDAHKGRLFGHTVVMSSAGDVVAAGALDYEYDNILAGAVYVFRWDGAAWDEAKIKPSDADVQWNNDMLFGSALAMDAEGKVLVVGAPYHTPEPGDSDWPGAVYVFERHGENSWEETAFFPAEVPGPSSVALGMGGSLSMNAQGDRFITCQDFFIEDENLFEEVSSLLFIFEKDHGTGLWNYTKMILDQASNLVGFEVALSGDGTIMGFTATNAIHLWHETGTNQWEQHILDLTNVTSEEFQPYYSGIALNHDGTVLASVSSYEILAFRREGDIWDVDHVEAFPNTSSYFRRPIVSINSQGTYIATKVPENPINIQADGVVLEYVEEEETWALHLLGDAYERDFSDVDLSDSDPPKLVFGYAVASDRVEDEGALYIYTTPEPPATAPTYLYVIAAGGLVCLFAVIGLLYRQERQRLPSISFNIEKFPKVITLKPQESADPASPPNVVRPIEI